MDHDLEKKPAGSEKALRDLIKALSGKSGDEYFQSMVFALRQTTQATCTFIGRCEQGNQIRMLAVAHGDQLIANTTYPIAGSPCEGVVGGQVCICSSGAMGKYPNSPLLEEFNVQGYLGVPICDHNEKTLGILVSLFEEPVDDFAPYQSIFELFAVSVGTEIERMETVLSLRESEMRFRLMTENLPSVVWTTDQDGCTKYISPNVKEVYGYSADEIQAAGEELWLMRIHDEDRARVADSFAALFRDGLPFDVEYRIRRKDGEWIWLHDRAKTTDHVDGKRVACGVFSDITDRVRANQLLRDSQCQYEQLVEGTADLITTVDAQGNFVYVNQVAEKIFGIPLSECLGKSAFHFVHPDDRERTRGWFQDNLANKIELATIENRQVSTTGQVYTLLWSCTLRYDDNGIFRSAAGTGRDITAAKETQLELLRTNQRFEQLAESIDDLFWMLKVHPDQTVEVLFVNSAFERMWQCSVDTFREAPMGVFNAIHDDDRELVIKSFRELLSGVGKYDVEFRVVRPDGTMRFVASRANMIPDENGELTQVAGLARDITEYKQVQQELIESNERFSQLAENTDDVFWLVNVTETGGVQVLYANPAFERFFQRPIGDFYANPLCVFDGLHEDDRERIETAFSNFTQGKGGYDVEARFITPDGSIRWVAATAKRIVSDDGNSVRIAGITHDITHRKRAEEALEKQIIALTQPLDDTSQISFDDLFNLEDVQRLQDEFANATGVASIITLVDGRPITRPSNFCRLCNDIIRKSKKGCINCYKSDAALGCKKADGPTIQPCMSGGLWDAGAAISVGGKHIANWLIGQVRDSMQTEEMIRKYARQIEVDEDLAVEAFLEVPSMPLEQFQAVAQALFTLAQQLSNTAYQNVQQARFIADKEAVQGELQRKEKDLRVTLESIGDAVIATDTHGAITRMNPVAEVLTGWSREDAVERPLGDVFHILHAETREPKESPVDKVLSTGEVVGLAQQSILIAKDGSEFQIADSGAPIRTDAGEILGVVLVFRDVTGEIATQEQLLHSQKMDAIGQLAGGVAHDFNNVLGGIMGAAEILKRRVSEDPQIGAFLDIIIDSSERAAGLTEKLLTFARKQAPTVVPLDLHSTLNDTLALLERTIDPRIAVAVELAAEHAHVLGDASQLQNAFLNLGINASHSMPDGGTLTLTTRNLELDEAYCLASTFELTAGTFLEVEVRDTGEGIPFDHLPKIFEPFFTTKGQGRGTGLGLAAVYGTVQQHQGEISVYSEVDTGTSFHVLLPLGDQQLEQKEESISRQHGSGGILIIDDEEMMRVTASAILEELGYDVITAGNGKEGLSLFMKEQDHIDLIILDMIMPEMNGRDCFAEIRKVDKEIPVLVASGFSLESDLEEMRVQGLAGLIRKPFRGSALGEAVYDALNS